MQPAARLWVGLGGKLARGGEGGGGLFQSLHAHWWGEVEVVETALHMATEAWGREAVLLKCVDVVVVETQLLDHYYGVEESGDSIRVGGTLEFLRSERGRGGMKNRQPRRRNKLVIKWNQEEKNHTLAKHTRQVTTLIPPIKNRI